MAQVLKLKRTAVQGKVPTTSSLELGELAINTYDGRIFFEKDNGTPSIQTILVTDATATGSINIIGAITASYFKGDGSALTNLPNADVSQVATVTASFENQTHIDVVHNFDTRNVLVSVYDTNYAQIIPASITLVSNNTASIELSSAQSGFAVVAKGGHIVSGTLVQEVTEVATVTASFDNQSTISVVHNFNSKNILISVYDANDSQIIPSSTTLTNLNTATITLSSPQSGYIVVAKGGHLVTATGTISYNNLTDIPVGIISSSIGVPNGTVSGSSQLTSSYDTRYVLSGSITQTTWDNIANKPSGIISSSSQIDVLATTNISRLATTGSNIFIGTQNVSGSIIPGGDSLYDLGDITHQFRHLYLSSGSLYIDGTKVLGSANQELQITTDTGQSFKILEAGTDTITLQSADGDIQLKTSGGGNVLIDPTTGLIDIRGTFQIQDGYKITSSGGNVIQFGNDVGVTGSISTTGNINGINLSTFSSSLDNRISNQTIQLSSLQASTGSYETIGRGIVSGSSQITSLLPIGVVSGSSQVTYSGLSSIPAGIVSGSTQVTPLLPTGTISGSSQVLLSSINGFGTYIDQPILTNSNVSHNSIATAGSASIGSNLTVYGNLQVFGTQSIINSTNLEVADNIIYLAPTASGDWDLGIVGHYNDGTYSHAGIFSDASDGHAWKVFKGLTGETTGSVDTSAPSFTLADFKAGAFTGTSFTGIHNGIINSTNGVVSGSSQITYTNISSIPTGIVSGSVQISHDSTTGYSANKHIDHTAVSITAGTGLSGGGDISTTRTLAIDTAITATITGSQTLTNKTISGASNTLSNIGNSSLTNSTITIAGTSTSLGGSITLATITNGSGIVSGSSQIDVMSTTNITRLATTGSNSFTANQAITGSGYVVYNIRTLSSANNSNYQLGNDTTGNGAGMALFGSTYSTSGQYRQSGAYIYSNQTGGLTLHAEGTNSMYLSTNGTTAITISSAQNATFAGTITENSSIRYKENVETIKNGLDKVLQMRGVRYDRKDTNETEIGLIAEELDTILPEVVNKTKDGLPDSVAYGRIVGVLIEAIKEQQKQIEELKAALIK